MDLSKNDNSIGQSELRQLFIEDNRNVRNAYTNFRLALYFQSQSYDYRLRLHKKRMMNCLIEGLEAELKTGLRDPKYGLEQFVKVESKDVTSLFSDQEKRKVENILQCISNIDGLQKARYESVTWDDVRTVLAGFSGIEDLAVASSKILKVAKEEDARDRKYITPESLGFLKRCVNTPLPFDADDIGTALEFYSERREAFMPTSDPKNEENLVNYFLHLKKYFREWALVDLYCLDRTVRSPATFAKPQQLVDVLGDRGKDLAEKLQENPDDENLKNRICIEAMLRILERNQLKTRLGAVRYQTIIQNILKPEFFDTLKKEGEITNEQYRAIKSFLDTFQPSQIPIYETRNPIVSLNETYYLSIRLGNVGVLRAFLKIVPKERKDFFEREKFLMRDCKQTLKDRGINLPLYEGFCEYDDLSVSMFGFINGHNLYYLINNPSLFVGDATRSDADLDQLTRQKKIEVFRNATVQLALIQTAVRDIAEQENKQPQPRLIPQTIGEKSAYFTNQLSGQFIKNRKTISNGVYEEVLKNFADINNFLVLESIRDGVYYKDSNPRNVMVQFSSQTGRTNLQVIHVDYEYGAKILGEPDLVKLLRNGKDLREFKKDMDYRCDDQKGFDRALEYVGGLRYLEEQEERSMIECYCIERHKIFDDEARLRYDIASVYIHFWYIAWYAHKAEEREISEETKLINRMNYHLLEAKLTIDKLRKNDSFQNEKLNLDSLRVSLDKIQMYGPQFS